MEAGDKAEVPAGTMGGHRQALLSIALLLAFRIGAAGGRPVRVEPPMGGRWHAVHTQDQKIPSHGLHAYPQTYALDLARPHEVQDSPWWPLTRRAADYPSFGEPVLAVADGTFGTYAHRRPRSARIETGRRVSVGQGIAECGTRATPRPPQPHHHRWAPRRVRPPPRQRSADRPPTGGPTGRVRPRTRRQPGQPLNRRPVQRTLACVEASTARPMACAIGMCRTTDLPEPSSKRRVSQ